MAENEATTPQENKAGGPAAGALPPLPTAGVTAERLTGSVDPRAERPAVAAASEPTGDPDVTPASAGRRRVATPVAAVLAVVLVALLAATLAFRGGDDSPSDIAGQEVEPVVLAEPWAATGGNGLLPFGMPVLLAESPNTSFPVWQVTVEPPRGATDEARAHRSANEPKSNHEFIAVSVELKLVASASGVEFPPTDWLLEGDAPSPHIDLPSIPDIDTCSLPDNFVSLPLKVGESMRGTFCAEVHLLDIPEETTVRLTVGGQRFRFGGFGNTTTEETS